MRIRLAINGLLLTGVMCAVGAGQTYYPPAPRAPGLGILGGLAGAGIGAALGEDGGDALPGAAIGGAIGALGGAVVGGAMDQEDARRQAYWNARQYQQQQQLAQAVTLTDVVSMAHAGLGDEVIVNQIRTRGLAQLLTTSDLISLKQQGVSDRVIGAMQALPRSVPVFVQPAPPPVVVEQYYYARPYYRPMYFGPHHHPRPPGLNFHWHSHR